MELPVAPRECTYHQSPQMSKDKKAVFGSRNGDIQSLQTRQESKQQQESYFCMQNGIISLQRLQAVLEAASPEPLPS